ncbi:putative MATH/TRAF domain-containing protein [Helianthus anomalus]
MAIGESGTHASFTQGALRSTSEAPPTHYILNIQQFSSLTKHNVERYESNEFEAGAYKWYFFFSLIYLIGNRGV